VHQQEIQAGQALYNFRRCLIEIIALDSIKIIGRAIDGTSSGVFTSSDSFLGEAGDISLITGTLNTEDGGRMSSQSLGIEKAGNISIKTRENIHLSDGEISTVALLSSGGDINIKAADITLKDTNIASSVFSDAINSDRIGGNIEITADSIIAFDDSDIFAFAANGQGGNITLNTPAYFGENFTLNSLDEDFNSLIYNNRADINATGAVSGVVTIPDVSFIQNSLNDLPNNSINTDELVANSCVSPVGNRQEGKFIITGKGGLPARPGNGDISDFATGEVRNVPSSQTGWKRGDPIVEPQGLYHLSNGKLVLSRECH
jgi:hypothetical protein